MLPLADSYKTVCDFVVHLGQMVSEKRRPSAVPVGFGEWLGTNQLKKTRNFAIYEQQNGAEMSTSVAQMTKKELAQMLSTVVEQKLIELLGDPDEGLVLKAALRKRLVRQKKAVVRGERGIDFSEVRNRLGR